MSKKVQYQSVLNKSNHGSFTIEDEEDDNVEIILNGADEINSRSGDIPSGQAKLSPFAICGKLWGTITFSWMKPLLELGNLRALVQSDLYELDSADSAIGVFAAFRQQWVNELKKEGKIKGSSSLALAFMNAFGGPFMCAGFLKLVHDSCLFMGPMLLNNLINLLSDPSKPATIGYFYVLGLFLANLAMSICLRQYFW